MLRWVLLCLALSGPLPAAGDAILVATPMAPPGWALLERELLRANSAACERFAEKYLDGSTSA